MTRTATAELDSKIKGRTAAFLCGINVMSLLYHIGEGSAILASFSTLALVALAWVAVNA